MAIFGMENNYLNDNKAIFTATEVNQQPNTWEKTYNQVLEMRNELKAFINNVITKDDFDIILTGAGTSEFVGNSVYAYLNKITGHYKVKSYGTTDLVANPEYYLSDSKPTLLISYGRSGNSPESVGAVDVANVVCKDNVYHLFITCNDKGALSKLADESKNCFAINLTEETHDKSFAMTSSYTNMYLATVLCFHLDELEKIKPILDSVISNANTLLEKQYTEFKKVVDEFNFNRIVYLGAGTLKGVAQESALKMLELSAGKVVTMFDTPLGFRHGPKSIINPDTLCVMYLSDCDYSYQYELDLIKEMSSQRKGNRIFVVSNKFRPEVESLVDHYIHLDTESKETVFNGLYFIIAAQIIALFKSLSLGLTPDNPWPSGEVNRVVQGVILYPYTK